MAFIHTGNNIFYGEDINEIINPSENSVFTNIYSGDLSIFKNGNWSTTSYGGRNDQLFFQVTRQISLNAIGTTYKDIFSAFYQGYPQGIDCNGYTKIGFICLWNKNSGTGIHDIRVITTEQTPRTLFNTESVRVANGSAQDGLPSGMIESYNISIPTDLRSFRGKVKLQAKSTVGTDNPIFDACNFYLLR